jgi:hypothetical protein
LHRERRPFRRVVDALFFRQRNPGHCERAYRSDLSRARDYLAQDGAGSDLV